MNAGVSAALRRGRRLLVVDVENVVRGGVRTAVSAAEAKCLVDRALAVLPGEQVIVGVSSVDGLFHAAKAWPQARVVLGFGPDGADHALLDVLDDESVGERFDRVSIVSGDGIFADAASALARQAVVVTAVGWRGSIAGRLRLAAARVEFLDDHDPSDVGFAA